ncbi:MAG: polyprenyl synthetase family protein [Chloroflexota bacterium]
MDIFQSIIEYLSTIPVIESWPELKDLLKRAASRKPRAWWLPVIACQSVGGSFEQAIPASAALACIQVSLVLIDDMLDKDPRGEYHQIGEAQVANIASALQAAGVEAYFCGEFSPSIKTSMVRSTNQMIMSTTFGQYLDIKNPLDETAYWQIVDSKSAPFFETAFYISGLSGGASKSVSKKLKQFGHLYGEIIQIHDDLNDAMAIPANPDWTQNRSPLPILFARLVDHPSRPRFLELCQDLSQPEALREAQDILIHSGAVSYCVDQLLQRYRTARKLLESIPLVESKAMNELLEELITPVRRLFQSMGKSLSVFST